MEANGNLKTVVVLGLARSGTSVVTGMLGILGVEMGSESYADKANPRGSFEDGDFAELHRKIFQLAGADRDYWNPPDLQEILGVKERCASIVEAIISEKSRKSQVWGWKHSRTILTIGLFLPHLCNPHFVVVYRNPLGTARSSVEHTRNYKRRVGFMDALKLVQFYHGHMVSFLERHPDLPKIFVSFEDVVLEPAKEAARLADFLGLDLSQEKKAEIDRFVIPRGTIEVEKRKTTGGVPGKVGRMFKNLLRV